MKVTRKKLFALLNIIFRAEGGAGVAGAVLAVGFVVGLVSVSDGKIKTTTLILRHGALSTCS